MNSKKTWQDILGQSETARTKGEKFKKQAGVLLWDGALGAIGAWDSAADADGDALYTEAVDALGGKHRKGDASKIRTVALATKAVAGYDVTSFPNLSKAYTEAVRATKTVKTEAEEDVAADEAVSTIEAPKSASTPESAAKIVLAKGVDEAARLLLDALGTENTPAHRALLRSVSEEITGRIKAKAQAEANAKKAESEAKRAEAQRLIEEKKAKATAEKEAKAAERAEAKAKGATKAKGEAKPATAKAKPQVAKAKPATAKAKPAPVDEALPVEVEETPAPAPKAKPQVAKRVAVARRAVPRR